MASFVKITFLATGKVDEYPTSDYYCYVLDDGTYEDVITTFGWCNHCRRVTGSELVEPLEALDTAIADLSDPNSAVNQQYIRFYPKNKERECAIDLYRAVLSDRRRWLVRRISPAKCLTCGTSDIIILKQWEEVETPEGKIRMTPTARHAYIGNQPRYFSQEGDCIEHSPPPKEKQLPVRKWWQFWR